jgi:hypothetical protein
MDVRIEQMTTTVDSVDPSALLTPAMLAEIVDAVIVRLEKTRRAERSRATEVDTRSVVDQQRDGRR